MVWAKFDDQYPDNPKIAPLSDAAFRLHTSSICYSARVLMDGRIPKAIAHRYVAKGRTVAGELIRSGLFTDDGDNYIINDFLDYNPTREQVQAIKEARAKAGAKGGSTKRQANALASAETNGKQNRTPYPYPVPDKETSQDLHPGDVAARMAVVCKNGSSREAFEVVTALAEHVDLRLVDECVGWASKLDHQHQPVGPRYFLKAVRDWAKDRGVVVPELTVVDNRVEEPA